MSISAFIKSKKFYIPAVLVLIVVGYLVFGQGKNGDLEVEIVEAKSLRQVVSETGEIKPAKSISLSFAGSGHVTQMLVDEGDKIEQGQLLASLKADSASADLQQAAANLERERVALEELLSPPTEEDLAISATSIKEAEANLENTRLALIDSVSGAYIKADDAIHAKADKLFKNPGGSRAQFGITISQGSSTYRIEAAGSNESDINIIRRDLESELEALGEIVFGESTSDPVSDAQIAEATLLNVQKMLTIIANELGRYESSDDAAQTIYEGYRSDISAARLSVNTALTALRTNMQTYNSAQVAVEVPQNELDFKVADPKEETIRVQEVRIREAAARVASVRANLQDSFIYSPINGLVTDVLVDVGEVIARGALALTVISDADLEISIFIPEDDFEFVDIGDKAEVQFDAYNNLTLEAEVVFVSPSAEIIDGVPAFEITLNFVEEDDRIKPGLSVDVDIIAEETDEILSVPSRAIIDKNEKQFVRILKDKESYYLQEVVLGLKGEDGFIEVISGIEVGDRVITFASEEELSSLNLIE